MTRKIQNPVLTGSYPSPSVVRVDDDFYMATASYGYFPGIPVFHSRDLVHWEQIGHALDRREQLPLNAEMLSYGVWGPTIRYHDGAFYISAANIDHGFCFIITAEDPAGPWSQPHWLNAYGIDPSLFWDDDGRAYLTLTGYSSEFRNQKTYISAVDPDEFRLTGEMKPIWNGAVKDVWAPEAPHIYKKDGWYYLLASEGGSEHYYAVTAARSRDIFGPYAGYEGNPILTHRHLGIRWPIDSVGHCDLTELKDGSWYMALMGSRPYGGYHKNLGREVFIVPVVWENGWPLVSPGTGKVEWEYPAPDLPESETSENEASETDIPEPDIAKPDIPKSDIAKTDIPEPAERDDFDEDYLALCWNFPGTPGADTYRLEDGCLKLRLESFSFEKHRFSDFFENVEAKVQSCAFAGRRQQHMDFDAAAQMEFVPEENQTAGIMLLQNNFHLLRLEAACEDGRTVLRAVKGYTAAEPSLNFRMGDKTYYKEICGEIPWKGGKVILRARVRGQRCTFTVCAGTDGAADTGGTAGTAGTDGTTGAERTVCRDGAPQGETVVAENLDCSFLGAETAGGFLGTYVGMFASGNGTDYEKYAAFDWFEYSPAEMKESEHR